jgi:rhodanese-related sulfurtransferase
MGPRSSGSEGLLISLPMKMVMLFIVVMVGLSAPVTGFSCNVDALSLMKRSSYLSGATHCSRPTRSAVIARNRPPVSLKMSDEEEDEDAVEDDIPLDVRMDALRRMRKFKEMQSGQTLLQSGDYRETETPIEIDVRKAKEILSETDDEAPPFLMDVREISEYDFCHIDGSVLIPMSEVKDRSVEVPKDRLVMVYCHHGIRSMQVVRYLRTRGWNQITNVRGGIDAWSNNIDPSVPRY